MQENQLSLTKHLLFSIKDDRNDSNKTDIEYLENNFCGIVLKDVKELDTFGADRLSYIYGNIKELLDQLQNKDKIFYVIQELSYNYDNVDDHICAISLGQVPINIHNVGVFFRNFFDASKDYFNLLTKEHQFQSLTESNKEGVSYRKGIYLSKVAKTDEGVKFNLLRCSTNLNGATDSFKESDHEIITQVNNISKHLFEQEVELNHVLAQVYNNATVDGKQKKAKIKEHSDKTKDMPRNGLMAFCTFYHFDHDCRKYPYSVKDTYDYCYKDTSVLTKLRFRLKKCVDDDTLVESFDLTLYPNSVFIMSLSMNRLYTHEIIPPHLPVDKIPTRLGYVIRCSKTEAIFKDGQTFIKDNDGLIKLEETTPEKEKLLKSLYYKENTTADIIDYGVIDFSLNLGDYMEPIL